MVGKKNINNIIGFGLLYYFFVGGKMVSFLEEIAKVSGVDPSVVVGSSRVLYLGGKVVVIEGKTRLIEMSGELVKVKLKRGMAVVGGKNLKLKNLNLESVMIVGDIAEFQIC